MSTTANVVGAVAPVTRRVRAYFAPVNRAAGVPTVFDAAQMGAFALDAPPAPWMDLGWCSKFARKSETKVGALTTGAPAALGWCGRWILPLGVGISSGSLPLAVFL